MGEGPDPYWIPFQRRLLADLAALASLCRRLYLGSACTDERRKKTVLQFFIYFGYPIDLDPPVFGVDDDF
jgi:hypothetical protein